jgi:hypothetical protein
MWDAAQRDKFTKRPAIYPGTSSVSTPHFRLLPGQKPALVPEIFYVRTRSEDVTHPAGDL